MIVLYIKSTNVLNPAKLNVIQLPMYSFALVGELHYQYMISLMEIFGLERYYYFFNKIAFFRIEMYIAHASII